MKMKCSANAYFYTCFANIEMGKGHLENALNILKVGYNKNAIPKEIIKTLYRKLSPKLKDKEENNENITMELNILPEVNNKENNFIYNENESKTYKSDTKFRPFGTNVQNTENNGVNSIVNKRRKLGKLGRVQRVLVNSEQNLNKPNSESQIQERNNDNVPIENKNSLPNTSVEKFLSSPTKSLTKKVKTLNISDPVLIEAKESSIQIDNKITVKSNTIESKSLDIEKDQSNIILEISRETDQSNPSNNGKIYDNEMDVIVPNSENLKNEEETNLIIEKK